MSDMATSGVKRMWGWALLPLAAAQLIMILLFWSTASTMVATWWRSGTFTHAFVVPPMVLWLAWRRHSELLGLAPRPAFWVLLPMAVVAAAWMIGDLVSVNAVTQLAFVALLVLAVPAVLGTQVARTLAFPLCFAFFAVPVGEFALPVLMKWTADFTVGALRISGVPVFREGLRFVIPTGSWSVVEACSGVRYLIASLMVGSLFAYLNYRSRKRRLIFVGLSILVPIVANWIRAYMIVMLGHISNNQIATGVDHLVYGWVFFGVVIMTLFSIGARWAEPEDSPSVSLARPTEPAIAAISNLPRQWVAASLIAVLAIAPTLLLVRLNAARASTHAVVLTLPDATGSGWRATPGSAVEWAPDFRNPSATVGKFYALASETRVGVHIAYFKHQQDDSKVVSSSNFIHRADDFLWNPLSVSDRAVADASGGGQWVVRETVLLASEQPGRPSRELIKIWMAYWIDGLWTSSDFDAKFKSAWARLNGRGDDGAAVMMYASDHQPGGADRALTNFWRDNRSLLEARLVAARDGTP